MQQKTVMFLIGMILLLLSVGAGLYVAFGVMFVGGVVEIFNVIKVLIRGGDTNALNLGYGILKIIFAGFAGWITFGVGALISSIFFSASD